MSKKKVPGDKRTDTEFETLFVLVELADKTRHTLLNRGKRQIGRYRALDNLDADKLKRAEIVRHKLEDLVKFFDTSTIDRLKITRKKQSPKNKS